MQFGGEISVRALSVAEGLKQINAAWQPEWCRVYVSASEAAWIEALQAAGYRVMGGYDVPDGFCLIVMQGESS